MAELIPFVYKYRGKRSDIIINLSVFYESLDAWLSNRSANDAAMKYPWDETDFLRMDEILKSQGKSKLLIIRNLQAFHVMRATGCRVGELLGVKTNDFEQSKSGQFYILFTKRREYHLDSRSNPASIKTRGRRSKISSELSELVKFYIKLRHSLHLSSKHSFLICSQQGKPLSDDSIRYVFKKLSDSFGRSITPHSLRHAWACNYMIQEIKFSEWSKS